MSVTSGHLSMKEFARLSRDMSFWKMCPGTERLDWTKSKRIWPKRGIVRNGVAYALPKLGHHIIGKGSSFSRLLPTPTASDYKRGNARADLARRSPSIMACDFHFADHSEYGLLVERFGEWNMDRRGSIPFPVHVDEEGRRRTRVEFIEWMMGLPPGWVTAPMLGLSRTRIVKLLGNGVVPQQAAAALEVLLEMDEIEGV